MRLRNIQYHVAYKRKKEEVYTIISNNLNTWVADPFIFFYKNNLYIFGEIWKYAYGKNARGVIGFTKMQNGRFTKWTEVIEEDYHLSFPNIFEYDGEVYICPESSEIGEIYLYRAVDFPYKWEKVKVLYDGGKKLVDTVFFESDSKKYGFTYEIGCNSQNGKLFLFDLNEEKIHFLDDNPISIDDASARCAGNVLFKDGSYIRVSQDCKGEYGKGLVFSEFCLRPKFTEKVIKTIYPKDIRIDKKLNLIGVHTYNCLDDYEVIDVKSFDFSLSRLVFRMLYRVRRMFDGG